MVLLYNLFGLIWASVALWETSAAGLTGLAKAGQGRGGQRLCGCRCGRRPVTGAWHPACTAAACLPRPPSITRGVGPATGLTARPAVPTPGPAGRSPHDLCAVQRRMIVWGKGEIVKLRKLFQYFWREKSSLGWVGSDRGSARPRRTGRDGSTQFHAALVKSITGLARVPAPSAGPAATQIHLSAIFGSSLITPLFYSDFQDYRIFLRNCPDQLVFMATAVHAGVHAIITRTYIHPSK